MTFPVYRNPTLRGIPAAATIDYKDARDRAMKKVEEREHLRLELKAREYIQVCHQVIDTLVEGKEEVSLSPGAEPSIVPLDRARVAALKTAMDGSLRLLDRVLPPLKAVEVTDSPERQADAMTLTTTELLELAGHMKDLKPVIEGEVSEAEEAPPWE